MFQSIKARLAGIYAKSAPQPAADVEATTSKYTVRRLKASGDLFRPTGPLLVQGPSESVLFEISGNVTIGVSEATLWTADLHSNDIRHQMLLDSPEEAKAAYKLVLENLTGDRPKARPQVHSSSAARSWFKRIVVGAGWLLLAMAMLIAWALATSTGPSNQQMLNANASPGAQPTHQGQRAPQMREPTLEELAAGATYTPNIRVTPPDVQMPTLSCAPK